MQTVYLTRRNLLTLLSKLDRAANGEDTMKSIVKYDTLHPEFPCSDAIQVIAVEDKDYYKHRNPGNVLPEDEKTIMMKAPNIGKVYFRHDIEDSWYDFIVDGKKQGEYHHLFQLVAEAKKLGLRVVWGEDQDNQYRPDELK